MKIEKCRSGDVCARGVPVFGRDCRVALCAPRNDEAFLCLFAYRLSFTSYLLPCYLYTFPSPLFSQILN
ncbi:MAG: hypothetical protein LBL66_05105 [Clostridiales bacterium]|nr:hypothetical protein [Clostridiales bacterium]